MGLFNVHPGVQEMGLFIQGSKRWGCSSRGSRDGTVHPRIQEMGANFKNILQQKATYNFSLNKRRKVNWDKRKVDVCRDNLSRQTSIGRMPHTIKIWPKCTTARDYLTNLYLIKDPYMLRIRIPKFAVTILMSNK